MTAAGNPSARRAASLYDRGYAERYRAHDDTLAGSAPYQGFVAWLQRVCERFGSPIDVLDLGCGTGRYFSALGCARTITGIDASSDMLEMARAPINSGRIAASRVTLIHDDLFTHHFEAGSFDLVYSVGVLAEHAPLDEAIVSRVYTWLRAGGRFAFSTVHPDSPSVRATPARSLARLAAPWLPAALGRPLRRRLLGGGWYADEPWIAELLGGRFAIESLERFVSEAHVHCLCVARKAAA